MESVPVGPVGSVEKVLFGGEVPQRGLLGAGDGQHRRRIEIRRAPTIAHGAMIESCLAEVICSAK